MSNHASCHHPYADRVVFVGRAARGARDLSRALERLGCETAEASSVSEIGGARPPAAVVVAAQDGVDPFQGVRAVRKRRRFAHSLVFAWTPAGFDPPIGVAVAAGADDVVGERTAIEEAVDRVVGRLAHSRNLQERATFDCRTQIRGRLFVCEWLSAEIGLAIEERGTASLAVVWLSGFGAARAQNGLLAAEADVDDAAFALATGLRPCDLPCRLSDDTFVVLLPGADASQAATVMEKAAERIAAKASSMPDVLVGVAEAPTEGATWQQLFLRAEGRLRLASPSRAAAQRQRHRAGSPTSA